MKDVAGASAEEAVSGVVDEVDHVGGLGSERKGASRDAGGAEDLLQDGSKSRLSLIRRLAALRPARRLRRECMSRSRWSGLDKVTPRQAWDRRKVEGRRSRRRSGAKIGKRA